MIEMRKWMVVAIVCLSHTFCALSQDLKADIEAYASLYKQKRYSTEIECFLYTDNEAHKLLEKYSFLVYKDGVNSYSKYGDVLTVSNSKQKVTINSHAKVISVVPVSNNDENNIVLSVEADKALKNVLQEQMEKLNKQLDSIKNNIEFKGVQNGEKVYRLSFPYGEIKTCDYYFSAKGKLLNRIVLYVRDPMQVSPNVFENVKLIVDCRKQDFKSKISKKQFSLTDVLSISKDGDVILQEKYKDYYVINHLKKN